MAESNPNDGKQIPSRQNPGDPPVPDSLSGPTSVAVAPVLRTLGTMGLAVAGGGAALLFAGALLTPCVGATRSARLSQGQRRQEIAEAILQINAEEQGLSASTNDADPRQ
jgi:hypothetical protein